ncbi:MAG: SPFH domain-containing protein [Bacteroidales bacterium]|jgi:regulator of protease activity HflC (stomatin/prohibitin superfamily)|nr:SPFH domain-containing protein [Bacteroidales bacterium]NPV35243.1 SPFH domain-containing protein [Bacteroidales bacterium]
MNKEKFVTPLSGYLGVLVTLVTIVAGILLLVYSNEDVFMIISGIVLLIATVFMMIGLMVINPNESAVLVLFGDYAGTVVKNGFFWVNPFYVRKKISLRARNLNADPIKVNDKLGNPIMIGIVLVWRVRNTYKAAFEVDDYNHFVEIQSEAAIRKLAGHYPYDNFDDEQKEVTLRSGGEEVNHVLEHELTERLDIAGIEVIEARISYLAYASEIASAMLQRQQATAIVAARQKIVEGAVGMVEMALDMLSKREIIELDDERKAAMVTNLMVVLTADKAATPVVNAGTLHH